MAWAKISVLLINEAEIELIADYSTINTPGDYQMIMKSGFHLIIRETDGPEAWADVQALYDRIRSQLP